MPEPGEPARWMSVPAAAHRIAVPEHVIRNWIRRGHLQPKRRNGRLAVHLDDVLDAERQARRQDATGTAARRITAIA